MHRELYSLRYYFSNEYLHWERSWTSLSMSQTLDSIAGSNTCYDLCYIFRFGDGPQIYVAFKYTACAIQVVYFHYKSQCLGADIF